jgi:succinate dehydrogenase / fumarate reductase cytochrome b subunit
MSQAAAQRALRLWQAPIGKKAVMAVTGVILFGFVFVHMAGNLQFFLGASHIDGYSHMLHAIPELLWLARAVLIVSVLLHVTAAVQLKAMTGAARPVRYHVHARLAGSYATATMLLGGLVLLAFVIFHLLHMTTGTVHPHFVDGAVHDNLVAGLSVAPVAIGYLVAMLALGLHLYHGVWSLTQSLGFNHPTHTPRIKAAAHAFAIVVALGFAALPIAILAGAGR